MNRFWIQWSFAAGLLFGCVEVKPLGSGGLTSFHVKVTGAHFPAGEPLPVVSSCLKEFGGTLESVPLERRGQPDCRYQIPAGEVVLDFEAQAVNHLGQPMADVSKPLTFRVTPGDLSGTYAERWVAMDAGVAKGSVRAVHVYGRVHLWIEDSPVALSYANGGVDGNLQELPDAGEPVSWATGLSDALYFEEPTLAKIQRPDGFDNRSSPFVGQFVKIGENPESGNIIYQSCPDDPERDGLPSTLVVTGLDPGGFFVSDLTACRIKEDTSPPSQVRDGKEPDGFLPGTFGSVYVYNYAYPDGLYPGDLLWTLSGSLQEFTSTTQLTFPSWSIRERIRELPVPEWGKYLNQAKPYPISLRTCGLDNVYNAFITDVTCGQNRRNLKMESLESSLVKLTNVRFPQEFRVCDLNGDGQIPQLCESLENGQWLWRDCNLDAPKVDCSSPKSLEDQEVCCNLRCVVGQGEAQPKVCSERTTLNNFGQYQVEMATAGLVEDVTDNSLSKRYELVTLSSTASVRTVNRLPQTEVQIRCDGNVRLAVGDGSVVATESDGLLEANRLFTYFPNDEETAVAFVPATPADVSTSCTVAPNTHTRMQVITREALPELAPDCNEMDENADAAQQCKYLRAATYDVVGHLKHSQPSRPRWIVIPRDADDVCCRPGPGMECPRPVKACP